MNKENSTNNALIRATLQAVQILAKRLTGDDLIVTLHIGDGTAWELSAEGDRAIGGIPDELSICGRTEISWSVPAAPQPEDTCDPQWAKLGKHR
jgi:hypothetical protein